MAAIITWNGGAEKKKKIILWRVWGDVQPDDSGIPWTTPPPFFWNNMENLGI